MALQWVHMCVRVRVCVYTFMSLSLSLYIYVYICIHKFVCVYIYMYVCMYINPHIHMRIYLASEECCEYVARAIFNMQVSSHTCRPRALSSWFLIRPQNLTIPWGTPLRSLLPFVSALGLRFANTHTQPSVSIETRIQSSPQPSFGLIFCLQHVDCHNVGPRHGSPMHERHHERCFGK